MICVHIWDELFGNRQNSSQRDSNPTQNTAAQVRMFLPLRHMLFRFNFKHPIYNTH